MRQTSKYNFYTELLDEKIVQHAIFNLPLEILIKEKIKLMKSILGSNINIELMKKKLNCIISSALEDIQ